MRCAGTLEPSASLLGAMSPSARGTPYEGSLLDAPADRSFFRALSPPSSLPFASTLLIEVVPHSNRQYGSNVARRPATPYDPGSSHRLRCSGVPLPSAAL